MRRAVVFDMDGVILDSERLAHASWLELGEQDGLEGIEEMYTEAMGHSEEDIAAQFRRRYGRDIYPAFSRRSVRWCRDHAPGGIIPLRAGARELLEFLKQRGVKIGLATSTVRETAESELADTGVLTYFDVIVAGDMVTHSKPDPEIYLKACEQLGVTPDTAWGVEDGRSGVRALHAAGIRAILAEDQYHPEPEIAALCETVVPSLEDVQKYLSDWL